MKKALTLSIVIPVYNEQDHIAACLDSIKAQTKPPLEVIIVDNNSTDKTLEIAKTYDLVRVVKETKQGRGYARSTGFNAAKGDILGRIDADSLLMPDWIERILADFSTNNIGAVTGPGQVRVVMGIGNWYSTFWTKVFLKMAKTYYGVQTLWGANMAVSAEAWQKIKNHVSNSEAYHEDQDISLVLVGAGFRIQYDKRLQIRTIGGSYLYWPKFLQYTLMNIRTKRLHKRKNTLKDVSVKRNLLIDIPVGLLSFAFTFLFAVYSLVCWPIIALIIHFDKGILDKKR